MDNKAKILHAVAQTLIGKSYVRGPLRITITKKPEVDEHGRLVIWVSATRNGTILDLDLPFIYVNPPLGIRHADGTLKVDHLKALKDIIAQTVAGF